MSHPIDADLDALAGRRVFFGHQSVGENILAGLRTLAAEARRDLPIVEWGQAPPPGANGGQSLVILHKKVGRNEQPLTKCDEFRRLLGAAKHDRRPAPWDGPWA